jgi:NADH-quinone oxidoreductase subunit L
MVKNGHKLEQFLAPIFAASTKLQGEHHADSGTEYALMGISMAVALVASILAWNIYRSKPELGEAKGLGKVLANKWYVDEIYDAIIVKPLNALSRFLDQFMEKLGIDWIVNGVGRGIQYTSRQLRLLQSGQVGNYVLLMIAGTLILFILQFFLKK